MPKDTTTALRMTLIRWLAATIATATMATATNATSSLRR
jgi:hypothetical protein